MAEEQLESTNEEVPDEYVAKLRYLLDIYRKPDGQKFSYQEIERGTEEKFGSERKIRYMWLWKLEKRQLKNPGQKNLALLTEFLGVKPGFWDMSLEEWRKSEKVSKVSANKGFENMQLIAARALELTPEAQEIVLDVIESLKKRGMSR